MKNKIMVFLITAIFTSLFFSPALAQTPPSEATGFNHFYIITQGDVPETTTTEEDNTLTIQDTMWYVIPINVSSVYLHVPAGGVLSEFYDLHDLYHDSNVSLSDEYPGWYSWKFSDTADRNVADATSDSSSSEFINGTFNNSVISVTGDQLELLGNNTQGEYVSPEITVSDAMDILNAKIGIDSNYPENITISISNDNGTNWLPVQNDTLADFTTSGIKLKYKIDINGNDIIKPIIYSVNIEYTYKPFKTELGLTSTYSFTSNAESPFYSFEKLMMYDIASSNVFVYLDSGYKIESTNVTWINNSAIDPAMLEQFGKPGKILTIGEIQPGTSFTFSIVEDDNTSSTNYLFYILLIAIIVIGGILFILKRPKSASSIEISNDESDEFEDEESEPSDDIEIDDETREELLARKKNILTAIKKLDTDLEEGLISEDIHEELKIKYKEEAVGILKKLDN